MKKTNIENSNDTVNNIINAYESYKVNQPRYCTYGNLAHMYRLFEKYIAIIRMLEKHNFADIKKKKIIDIGCGNGSLIRFFSDCRCSHEGLYGIDLREDIIMQGKNINPSIDISTSNAEELSFSESSFDIVCLQTVFSSVENVKMREKIVERINYLLKPNGLIIWYDFRYNNPKNPNVQGVTKKEISDLFKLYDISLKKITTIPLLQRKLPYQLWPLLGVISQLLPFLKSHYIGILVKKC